MKITGATDEWRRIARGSDVLFSIASVPGKKGNWTPAEFYAHGEGDWKGFHRHWADYWPELGGSCLEIGCGAGRLTVPLSRTFDHVVAVDVSADMLARARSVVPESVELHQVDGPVVPLDDASVNGVFSVHVMQHLENGDALLAYLREVRRVLRSGGSMMIHIELHGDKPPRTVDRLRDEMRLWRSRRNLHRGREHSAMRMRRYWSHDVYRMLTALGFRDLELRLITPQEFGHSCWFATAP